jgi:hypothetical protein
MPFYKHMDKQGRNSVSISRDGQGCTQKYEVELRQRKRGQVRPWASRSAVSNGRSRSLTQQPFLFTVTRFSRLPQGQARRFGAFSIL